MFAGKGTPSGMKTVDDFIREGSKLDRLEPLKWDAGDGARRSAFLCYSSGTSGLPVRERSVRKCKKTADKISRKEL